MLSVVEKVLHRILKHKRSTQTKYLRILVKTELIELRQYQLQSWSFCLDNAAVEKKFYKVYRNIKGHTTEISKTIIVKIELIELTNINYNRDHFC